MDVEEDIDYYLAMEEEAQMEEPNFEEGWDNGPEGEEVAEPSVPTLALPLPIPAPALPAATNLTQLSAKVAPVLAQLSKIR